MAKAPDLNFSSDSEKKDETPAQDTPPVDTPPVIPPVLEAVLPARVLTEAEAAKASVPCDWNITAGEGDTINAFHAGLQLNFSGTTEAFNKLYFRK